MAKNNGVGSWSLALLRIVLGLMFAMHGYAKLFVPGSFKATVGFFTSIGIPAPAYAALLVSVLEFLGGILLVIGLLTRLTSFALIIEMLVALFTVHLKQGFFIMPPAYGYEYVLLILAALVVVLANGAGALSAGRMFKGKWLQ